MRMFKLLMFIMVTIVSTVYGDSRGSFVTTADFTFKGKANGGTLFLCNIMARNAPFAYIETSPGESGESVVYRMAKEIAYTDAIFDHSHYKNFDKELALENMAKWNTLKISGLPGDYFVAGTEKGFDIPMPPLFLSCLYDEATDEIILNWENSSSVCDYILVRLFWTEFDHMGSRRVENSSTSLRISKKDIPVDINDLDVRVFGFRNNLPSNLSIIRLTNKGTCQSEEFGVPFTNNIVPNWKVWTVNKEIDTKVFEMGDKFGKTSMYNPALSISTKPFYQVIKGSESGDNYGIYRKFLGLTPGHTYRVIAGLTTLDMNSINEDWSFSVYAAYNYSKKDFTAKQFVGLSALPNGKKGPKAGEIASFGKNNKDTKGKFTIVGSDANSCITLPKDVNEITIWVKFNCKNPNGKVGFSGVKLEDVTDKQGVKTIEQIQQEEQYQEKKFSIEKKG
jgi:hypothetical protein